MKKNISIKWNKIQLWKLVCFIMQLKWNSTTTYPNIVKKTSARKKISYIMASLSPNFWKIIQAKTYTPFQPFVIKRLPHARHIINNRTPIVRTSPCIWVIIKIHALFPNIVKKTSARKKISYIMHNFPVYYVCNHFLHTNYFSFS
jgi:hypothetical protein